MKHNSEIHATGEQLLDIYLDGFTSGVCTALSSFSNLPQAAVIEIAQRMGNGMFSGESGSALIFNEIQERLDGDDSGPKLETIPIAMPVRLLATETILSTEN